MFQDRKVFDSTIPEEASAPNPINQMVEWRLPEKESSRELFQILEEQNRNRDQAGEDGPSEGDRDQDFGQHIQHEAAVILSLAVHDQGPTRADGRERVLKLPRGDQPAPNQDPERGQHLAGTQVQAPECKIQKS